MSGLVVMVSTQLLELFARPSGVYLEGIFADAAVGQHDVGSLSKGGHHHHGHAPSSNTVRRSRSNSLTNLAYG